MAFLDRFRKPHEPSKLERARTTIAEQHVKAQQQISEATLDLINNCVNIDDRFMGPDGEIWTALGAHGNDTATQVNTEPWLEEIRKHTRDLAERNEFAICGHENRINYIVGEGHKYTAMAKPEIKKVADETIQAVQAVLDAFVKEAKWGKRQQEIVRRKDRDGEAFLRFFVDSETKELRLRFVEPGQVSTPSHDTRERANMGILTAERDVETVEGYYVDGALVAPEEIQHRKANVDSTVKRGLPMFYPVEKNLRRVEKLLRNMSTVAGIQAAIAMIRRHSGAGADETTTTAWVQGHADVSVSNATLPTTFHERFAPGTILDAATNTEYDFPVAGIDAGRLVIVIQAELRAVACRLTMPEFMLTADASNANYSSTMVAEGPAVKAFTRLQATMVEEDREVFDRVLDLAVEAGMITQDQRDQVEVDVTTPTVVTRERLAETQADQILVSGKAMSVPTWQLRNELDPDHETELIDAQTKKNLANMEPFGLMRPEDGNEGQQPPSGQDSEGDDGEDN